MLKRIALTGLIVIAVTAPSLAATLSGPEMKDQMIGKTMKWKKGKYSGTIIMKSNGQAVVTIDQKVKVRKDTGKWWIKNNKLCSKYNKVRKGKAKCYTYKTSGAGFKDNEGGVLIP
ncbi:MAG: hypothetical protein OIF58_16695 [Cohaesibacter sp.]|nr:hypothetical protein [Cohaesibacter sp.]